MERIIHIRTPGRICLFGDHQDYLELPVIACAISRSVLLTAEENSDGVFRINLPDINTRRTISVAETFESFEQGDFFASALRVLRRNGCLPNKGYDLNFESTIPINAGTSSSSAMVVSWIHFLLTAFGANQPISNALIAKLAYEAEVVEQQSPGGKMDQYTIAMGHLVYMNTSQQFSVTELGRQLDGLILGVSGIPKKTIGLLGELRAKAQEAVAQVTKANPEFRLDEADLNTITTYSHHISESLLPYFRAAIKNHLITKAAKKVFENEPCDLKLIGCLMTEHHTILKEDLKITVPRIDRMIEAALKSGAYGAKIVGSGGGGSIVAIAPPQKKQLVINAIKSVGAVAAYAVTVAEGTKQLNESHA